MTRSFGYRSSGVGSAGGNDTAGSVTFSARFTSGRSVSGTFEEQAVLYDARGAVMDHCDTGVVYWRAHHSEPSAPCVTIPPRWDAAVTLWSPTR